MRVSDRQIFEAGRDGMLRAQARSARAAEELTSGRRVIHAADDPVAAGELVRLKDAAGRADAIARTTSAAAGELDAAEGALDAINNAVTRARELAMQMANSTYSAQDRAAAAVEVTQLTQFVISQVNVEHGGRYLMGGRADGSPPFDATGNYSGDGGTRQVELAPGVWTDASVRADVAFKGAGGGQDLFAVMAALATALQSDSIAGIQASLDGLDAVQKQVISARTTLGGQASLLGTASNVARAAKTGLDIRQADVADVDIAVAATQLAMAQRALEANIAATQKTTALTGLALLR